MPTPILKCLAKFKLFLQKSTKAMQETCVYLIGICSFHIPIVTFNDKAISFNKWGPYIALNFHWFVISHCVIDILNTQICINYMNDNQIEFEYSHRKYTFDMRNYHLPYRWNTLDLYFGNILYSFTNTLQTAEKFCVYCNSAKSYHLC